MNKLKVIKAFRDIKDPIEKNDYHTYNVGDLYPRNGEADPVRVKELKGTENKLKEAVIVEEAEVIEEVPAEEVEVIEETKELTKAEEKKAKKEAAK